MAVDTAQKRSIIMGRAPGVVFPTGTVDEIARGGALGLYYVIPPVSTGRRYWRRFGRKATGGR